MYGSTLELLRNNFILLADQRPLHGWGPRISLYDLPQTTIGYSGSGGSGGSGSGSTTNAMPFVVIVIGEFGWSITVHIVPGHVPVLPPIAAACTRCQGERL